MHSLFLLKKIMLSTDRVIVRDKNQKCRYIYLVDDFINTKLFEENKNKKVRFKRTTIPNVFIIEF